MFNYEYDVKVIEWLLVFGKGVKFVLLLIMMVVDGVLGLFGFVLFLIVLMVFIVIVSWGEFMMIFFVW